MSWLRIPVTINGVEYSITQQGPNDPVAITGVRNERDWVIVGAPTKRLGVRGKGWNGENPS